MILSNINSYENILFYMKYPNSGLGAFLDISESLLELTEILFWINRVSWVVVHAYRCLSLITTIFQVKTVVYDLPLKAKPSGSCSSNSSTITLSWTKGPAHLSLTMTLENGDNYWKTSSLVFTAKADKDQSLITNGTGW